jgi:hypothetical protein
MTWSKPAVLAALACALVLPSAAAGRVYLPPKHKVYLGVTGGDRVSPVVGATGRAPAAFQFFVAWDRSIDWTLARTRHARARLMLHLSTYRGPGTSEMITPRQIALGHGDDFILSLGRQIVFDYDNKPVYLRLMAEMNGHWNPYAYYNANGSPRDRAHSPLWYRQAFRRVTLILRGGHVRTLNHRLRRLKLPAVRHLPTLGQRPVRRIPHANVAMLWVPQTMGSPNIPSNMPGRFYPGDRYVDWVGTDFYSKYPMFSFLEPFYRRWAAGHHKPFVFGEWAMWGADDPRFVQRFIGWVRSHPRVRMISYNQGSEPSSPFRLSRFPRASHALRKLLKPSTFTGRVPEYPRGSARPAAVHRRRSRPGDRRRTHLSSTVGPRLVGAPPWWRASLLAPVPSSGSSLLGRWPVLPAAA